MARRRARRAASVRLRRDLMSCLNDRCLGGEIMRSWGSPAVGQRCGAMPRRAWSWTMAMIMLASKGVRLKSLPMRTIRSRHSGVRMSPCNSSAVRTANTQRGSAEPCRGVGRGAFLTVGGGLSVRRRGVARGCLAWCEVAARCVVFVERFRFPGAVDRCDPRPDVRCVGASCPGWRGGCAGMLLVPLGLDNLGGVVFLGRLLKQPPPGVLVWPVGCDYGPGKYDGGVHQLNNSTVFGVSKRG
jgi:hypothetical protein